VKQEPGEIPLQDAIRLVERARQAKLLTVQGWSYPVPLIRQLCDQPGAEGVRMYLAVNDDGDPTLVLVAVDESGRDMTDGSLMEFAWPCPPVCDPESPLAQGSSR
jgi:hypothetical protein